MKKICAICGIYRHKSTMIYSEIVGFWFCSNECLEQYQRQLFAESLKLRGRK